MQSLQTLSQRNHLPRHRHGRPSSMRMAALTFSTRPRLQPSGSLQLVRALPATYQAAPKGA